VTSSPPPSIVVFFHSLFHSRPRVHLSFFDSICASLVTASLATTTVNIVRETRLRDDEGERQTRVDGGEERQ